MQNVLAKRLAHALVTTCLVAGCASSAPDPSPTDRVAEAEGPSTSTPSAMKPLAFCSTDCGGGVTLTCNTSPCTARDFQYIICNNVRTACPPPPPPPDVCTAVLNCEAGDHLSCNGTGNQCFVLGAQSSKVCGGVECNGVASYCSPLPGELECF